MDSIEDEIRRMSLQQEEKFKHSLLTKLSKIDPSIFEQIVGDLLEQIDYRDIQVSRRHPDGGIDVKATKKNGILTIDVAVQVKRWKGNVGRKIIDEFRGVLQRGGIPQGVIVTTSDFTSEAKNAAKPNHQIPITLINGAELVDLLVQFGIGVKKKTYSVVEEEPDYWANLEGQKVEVSPVEIPQADNLDKVVEVATLVHQGLRSSNDVASKLDLVGRQGSYYASATILLGFLHTKDGKYSLTELGEKLTTATSSEREKILSLAVRSSTFFHSLIEYSRVNRKDNWTLREIAEYIRLITDLSETTSLRRAHTVMAWLLRTGEAVGDYNKITLGTKQSRLS
jgi:restriction system protein